MALHLSDPATMVVHVNATGQLLLSQAAGAPVPVAVTGLDLVFTAGHPTRVRIEGRPTTAATGAVAAPLTMATGRALDDLECTNPGLLDQLRRRWPHLPWYL